MTEPEISDDELFHYGTLRKSGRYPWGSGETSMQRNKMFLDTAAELKAQGLSESKIAEGMGITTTQLRAAKTIAKNATKRAEMDRAARMEQKGMSNVAIGEALDKNESSVRALLKDYHDDKADVLTSTASMLKEQMGDGYLQIGAGSHHHIPGVSETRLKQSIALLEEEGYKTQYLKVEQLSNPGKFTTIKVLTPPDTTYSELYKNQEKVKVINVDTDDNGHSYVGMQPPLNVDPKRVEVRYGSEGGADMDGVIQVRRGVDDVSLGKSQYAQVRIAVNGTHYLKGMAIYSDDLPDGVDLRFNTNKENKSGNKLDAMKPLSEDGENPFGAIVRQQWERDAKGDVKVTSAMNIVNEEGDWGKWNKSISSQALSKQMPSLAKQQLALKLASKQAEYDDIMALTNPAVRKKLLQSFSDDLDSSAVHLKAAALPRQSTQVILPINSLKDNEIYAPNYRNGEKVVLVRYPHGGIFEVPELTVNNKNREAGSVMKNARDAVGITSKVAERLSGADFDGDTVLVIPNNNGQFKTKKPLKDLEGFDAKASYPAYEGMKVMSARTKQLKMGDVSNLITDMTIRGASDSELARAVKHSMVVIDAEKHKLNYKQSYIDNRIGDLKKNYQGSSRSGATTLISQASSEQRVFDRKARSQAEGGPIDKATGQKMFVETGKSYVDKNGKTVRNTISSTRMAEVSDARKLSSGTTMEDVYANHANKLKTMANDARKSMVNTVDIPRNASSAAAYKFEVDTLSSKLNIALKNQPLERQAQLLATASYNTKRAASPELDAAQLKKLRTQELAQARVRTGARKEVVVITPKEWDAIQAGALSVKKLNDILNNADLDTVKQLAMPRDSVGLSSARLSRAKSMAASGYTQAEISDALGISTTTLNKELNG